MKQVNEHVNNILNNFNTSDFWVWGGGRENESLNAAGVHNMQKVDIDIDKMREVKRASAKYSLSLSVCRYVCMYVFPFRIVLFHGTFNPCKNISFSISIQVK